MKGISTIKVISAMNATTSRLQIFTMLMAAAAAIPTFGRDICGNVLAEDNAPLDFANVVLYCDSTYVGGGNTDTTGRFAITTDATCPLTARVSFAGYEAYTASVPESGDMGTITLSPTTVQLGEVTVKATRPVISLKGNSLVTTVAGSSLAIAGTANDVLVRVPMVVDNSGTLEVFGKGAPAIYINGRKVTDLQELSQLNSQDIKTVEVISNPGAAYAADVKSVIRIRTKPPKGDGWSGTLRTDNGFQHFFRTGNTVDLKYRTHGLEIFANYGWWWGHNLTDRDDDMTTTYASGTYLQKVHTSWKEKYNDMNGKIGFSWLINDSHSVGAYYRSGWNRHSMTGETPTEVWHLGALTQRIDTDMDNRSTTLPAHSANIYYNGQVGKLGIDFNADYLWTKQRQESYNYETGEADESRTVTNLSTNRNRMLAEKLVLGYPVWRGEISLGEEFTDTRSTNIFTTDLATIGDADTRVDESNIAVFAGIDQTFGRFNIGFGLRYEHVKYDYYEMGQRMEDRSRRYDNLFPSLSVATKVGSVKMGLNYSGKTVRPGYGDLDGTVSYINRLIYETGNPQLKSTKLQTVEYSAQWRRFFAQLSYTYFKDGVYHITEPFGSDGEATLIKTANLPHRHYFQAFAGAQFQVGAWQPRVNAGMMKQWLKLPVNGVPTSLGTPIFLLQWQNAIHLPFDIWLNVDAQLQTRGWENNVKLANTPWYINAKLYKGFLDNALSLTLEAKDLFDTGGSDLYLCNDAVQLSQKNHSPRRSVMLTVQYRFNTTRDRYRGTGAGNSEKSRF